MLDFLRRDCFDKLLSLIEALSFTDGLPTLLCANQSSINREAAPLLSLLISSFVRFMAVPWTGNQLNEPTGPHSSSTNLSRDMFLSTSYLYIARSSAGLFKYALGLRLMFVSKSSPVNNCNHLRTLIIKSNHMFKLEPYLKLHSDPKCAAHLNHDAITLVSISSNSKTLTQYCLA